MNSISRLKRGFTLVEVLVVISIIAILAGLGFAGFNTALQSAKKTSASTTLGQLVLACDNYYEEYQQLPLGGSSNSDEEKKTDNELMAALVGLDSASEENFKTINFTNFKKAKGKGQGAYDGLERTQNRAELLGPWNNKSKDDRYYRLVLNYDYDDELREPQALGNETLYNRKVIAYHMGKDGKMGGEYNKDNVYSWSKSD